MTKKKKRIALDETSAGLNDAFGGLSGLEGLDLAPAPRAPEFTPEASRPPLGSATLRRETAHRGGKAVVVVYDLAEHHSTDHIQTLSAQLKKHCGCGGTVKNRDIIIQGEKAAQVAAFLEKEGYRVKGVTR